MINTIKNNIYLISYISIFIISFLFRFIDLGNRAIHHDESLHGYFSYVTSNIINSLKSRNVDSIIMAGNINRPSLTDLSFDYQTFKLAKNLLLNKTGDDGLLISIKNYFNDNGFSYFDWKKHCPELFANKDILTQIKPSNRAHENLQKAISVFRSFGAIDVGQSIIVQNKIVLGLEAVEGTDNLIKRCKDYKKSGDRGVLVKFSKYNQSNILDIPTIGENTIRLLKDCDFEGLYLEKDRCLIIDKEKTIDLANQYKIFISTCNKIE